jgi:NAD(P)-dependent dehydrogenase (short-subunit alcohol dehydrogenase family)
MGVAARCRDRTQTETVTASRPAALVTGAANGIGRAIAKRLIDDGWSVAAFDLLRSGVARAFARERHVLSIEGDVADAAAVEKAVAGAIRTFGRLDGLVSNAGIMKRKPLRKLTLDEWRRVIDVNLTAAFLFARAAEKPLRRTKGAIVLIASTRALMSEVNTESYSASKGGLVALAHALAISLAPDVRVNCISPGWIATEKYGALRKKDHAQHPAGRVGKPEDIAEIAAYLLDGKRSGFVTGANIVADGGMTRKMIYEE